MIIPRLMIAAPKSNSGKTLVTCALLGALKKRQINIAACKCGPDYIDPMFHRTVLGIASENLDTFFTGEDETKRLFADFAKPYDMVLMEGVMGLYDGLGGIRREGSSYHLAEVTDTPIVLVVDVHGMGYSMIPFILGFLDYDTKHLIKGVILNRISKGFYETICPMIKKELSIEVYGYLEDKSRLKIDSRHLGLKLPNEIEDIRDILDKSTKYIEETVDVERLIELAGKVKKIDTKKKVSVSDETNRVIIDTHIIDNPKNLTLAVARDEAFCFYYDANIRMFKERGVKIRYFSPLHDDKLPEDIDGLLFGGGYPELYADKLSDNKSMLASVKKTISSGAPSLAECGGFIYLHKELEDDKKNTYPLVGMIDEKVNYKGRSVRFGYVELSDKGSRFLSEKYKIKGHEFHYYDSSNNGSDVCAVKPVTEKSWSCCYVSDNHWWGFPHLYYPSCPAFVDEFIKKMEQKSQNNYEFNNK